MLGNRSFAEQVLQFNENLSFKATDLPDEFNIINPYKGDQKKLVKRITTLFYQKYYNDNKIRRMILGSSPARKGSAVTGVPFEDAKHLQSETGIFLDKFYVNQSSSGFLYDVIRKYGGSEKFYDDFYMNFVCPLGLVKTNSKGNEVNCNYYESKKLQDILSPFIINSIRAQIDFGIDTSICYCIGSGGNYAYLSKINEKYAFFETIIPLEHPRFITQYNSKRKEVFLEKYLDALNL